MSYIYKIFAKILLKRVERILDEQQPIEQAGFRKHYSHVVRQILEKYKKYQRTYYMLSLITAKPLIPYSTKKYGKH